MAKKKEPPPIADGYKTNFETLKRACNDGNLALMSAIRKSDQQPVVLVCAVNRVKGGYDFAPLAVMCEGNPFDDFEPPK